jgi:hypothetical protein
MCVNPAAAPPPRKEEGSVPSTVGYPGCVHLSSWLQSKMVYLKTGRIQQRKRGREREMGGGENEFPSQIHTVP